MEWPRDQAASLRRPGAGARPAAGSAVAAGPDDARPGSALPLLAVASGKGGVGKTFLAINLALALSERGRRCLLADLDWGLANVDVALGLAPQRHIGHVIAGECSLAEALIDYDGLRILPNGCGDAELAHMAGDRRAAFVGALSRAPCDRDLLVADTHPGIGALTLDVVRAAAATVVVSTPEPTALTDTYALFKVLRDAEMRGPAGVVINQAHSADQACQAARHLDAVARRFLGRGIAYWGHVLQDAAVPQAIQQQRAVLVAAPRSPATRAIRALAGSLAGVMAAHGRGSAGPR